MKKIVGDETELCFENLKKSFSDRNGSVIKGSAIECNNERYRISMILARMISERDTCGSIFFPTGNDEILFSTNYTGTSEWYARSILKELAKFVKIPNESNRNVIINRAIVRTLTNIDRTNKAPSSLISDLEDYDKNNYLKDYIASLVEFLKNDENSDFSKIYSSWLGWIPVDQVLVQKFLLIIKGIVNGVVKQMVNDKEDSRKIIELIVSLTADLYGVDNFLTNWNNDGSPWKPIIKAISGKKFIKANLSEGNFSLNCKSYFGIVGKRKNWCDNCKNDRKCEEELRSKFFLHTEQKKIEHYGRSNDELKFFISKIFDNETYFGISKNLCFPCHLAFKSTFQVVIDKNQADFVDIDEEKIDKKIKELGCSGVIFESNCYAFAKEELANLIQRKINENLLPFISLEHSSMQENFPFNECFYSYKQSILKWVSEKNWEIMDSNQLEEKSLIESIES